MSEMKLSLQVQLDCHVFQTIFRLPPKLQAIRSECGDHVLNAMAVGIEGVVEGVLRITYETFFCPPGGG